MRTLFLMAILFFLVLIAVKKPDQTAWDAARELGDRVQTVVSEVREEPAVAPSTGEDGDKFADLKRRTQEALDRALARRSPLPGSKETIHSGNPGSSPVTPTPMGKPKSVTARKAEAPETPIGSLGSKAKPRSTEPPELPAIPVEPVEAGEIVKDVARPPSQPQARPSGEVILDYREVKAFYENASRLLAEIK